MRRICPEAEHRALCALKGRFFLLLLVLLLISVKTGLSLWPWANVVVALRVEVALHDIPLAVPIVCVCPTAWGIGNLSRFSFRSGSFWSGGFWSSIQLFGKRRCFWFVWRRDDFGPDSVRGTERNLDGIATIWGYTLA